MTTFCRTVAGCWRIESLEECFERLPRVRDRPPPLLRPPAGSGGSIDVIRELEDILAGWYGGLLSEERQRGEVELNGPSLVDASQLPQSINRTAKFFPATPQPHNQRPTLPALDPTPRTTSTTAKPRNTLSPPSPSPLLSPPSPLPPHPPPPPQYDEHRRHGRRRAYLRRRTRRMARNGQKMQIPERGGHEATM